MASLPDEIIAEILSRLPVKSLLCFRIVCKSWKSLIHNPNFVKLHLNQTLASNSNRHLIIHHKGIHITNLNLDNTHKPLSYSELHHPLKPQAVLIHGSCNGILCVSDINRNNVFLYNPLTNWYRKVPLNYFIHPVNRDKHVTYGFGYDSITDDYKVFSFLQKFDRQTWKIVHSEAQVLSFNTNSWKYVKCICHTECFQNYRGVYLNDAVYYTVLDKKSFRYIVKFDFRTDTMLRMECPKSDDINSVGNLNTYKGCLCMLVQYFCKREMGGSQLDRYVFWMMKESWVRLFSIRDPRSSGIGCSISIVVFSSDGRKILLEVDGRSKYGWYDLKDGSFEKISIVGHPKYSRLQACCTLGSLVSLVDDFEGARGRIVPKK